MKSVGLRELKNRLSEYIREVRGGEAVLVTDRGETVAELLPPGIRGDESNVPSSLVALARKGEITLGASNETAPYPKLPRLLKPRRALALLDEEQGRPVKVYAESSAVLAWLLGEEDGRRVRETLGQANLVTASDLTLIECDRVLIRAVALGEMDEAEAADRRGHLNAAAAHWHVWRLRADVVDRARRPFPAEPIRTLDAMHLSAALAVRSAVPGVELLSLDDRIRRSAGQLGFRLQPA